MEERNKTSITMGELISSAHAESTFGATPVSGTPCESEDDPFIPDSTLKERGITVTSKLISDVVKSAGATPMSSMGTMQGLGIAGQAKTGTENGTASTTVPADNTGNTDTQSFGTQPASDAEKAKPVDIGSAFDDEIEPRSSNVLPAPPDAPTVLEILQGFTNAAQKKRERKQSTTSKRDNEGTEVDNAQALMLSQIAELVDPATFKKIKGILLNNGRPVEIHVLGCEKSKSLAVTRDCINWLREHKNYYGNISAATLAGLILCNYLYDRVEDKAFFAYDLSELCQPYNAPSKPLFSVELSPLTDSRLNNLKETTGITRDTLLSLIFKNFITNCPAFEFDLNYIFDYTRYTSETPEELVYDLSTKSLDDPIFEDIIKCDYCVRQISSTSTVFISGIPCCDLGEDETLRDMTIQARQGTDITYLAFELNIENSTAKNNSSNLPSADENGKYNKRVLHALIKDGVVYLWNPSRGWLNWKV